MRIALAGKGGVGKTTLSASLARLAARAGRPVVAIDADSNPNLGSALGLGADDLARLGSLPNTLVSRRLDGGPALTAGLSDVLARHAVTAPDGVHLMMMGMPAHADEGCLCAAHATVSALLDDLGADPQRLTVVDLEASPEHLSRGTTRHIDAMLLVTEPYYRSLEATRRLAVLAAELPVPRVGVVGNKVRTPLESEAIAEFCERHDLELAGVVPDSDVVRSADVAARPLIESAGAEPVIGAVRALLDGLQSAAVADR
jgi:CO dehydrogenase maturation factor